jgi:hypothetical protein
MSWARPINTAERHETLSIRLLRRGRLDSVLVDTKPTVADEPLDRSEIRRSPMDRAAVPEQLIVWLVALALYFSDRRGPSPATSVRA